MQTEVMVMTAKELLDQLIDLRKDHANFDDLEVCVTVVDRRTYNEENADPPPDEMSDTVIADGTVYALAHAKSYDMNVSPPEYIGDYLLLRCIEEDNDD